MTEIERVYLFDIDGTLVNAQGMGGRAFRRAVRDVLQHELDWQIRDFAGMTDAGLFRRVLAERNQGSEHDLLAALDELYHKYLGQNLSTQPALVLPGAETLVARLASKQKIRIGLLTGNTRRGSELKLADLFSYFPFGFYGDEHAERSQLGVVAREQVTARFGAGVAITVIGDTPNDIICARAAGAECIAVTTGPYSAEELAAADRVLQNLTEWSPVPATL